MLGAVSLCVCVRLITQGMCPLLGRMHALWPLAVRSVGRASTCGRRAQREWPCACRYRKASGQIFRIFKACFPSATLEKASIDEAYLGALPRHVATAPPAVAQRPCSADACEAIGGRSAISSNSAYVAWQHIATPRVLARPADTSALHFEALSSLLRHGLLLMRVHVRRPHGRGRRKARQGQRHRRRPRQHFRGGRRELARARRAAGRAAGGRLPHGNRRAPHGAAACARQGGARLHRLCRCARGLLRGFLAPFVCWHVHLCAWHGILCAFVRWHVGARGAVQVARTV